jgi:hypothetical protein
MAGFTRRSFVATSGALLATKSLSETDQRKFRNHNGKRKRRYGRCTSQYFQFPCIRLAALFRFTEKWRNLS